MQGPEHMMIFLRQLWSPVIMVVASVEADELCFRSNGLTVSAMLRPFGVLRQLNGGLGVPVRTVAEQPLRLHAWMLRFYAGSDMFQPAPEAADAYLGQLLSQVASGADESVPEVQHLIDAAGIDDTTPWFTEYRREYFRTLAFGAHETMDHPVACLLVLPANFEGDAVSAFAELFERGMPPLMRQGGMEPRILRHHVLLHDAGHAAPGAFAVAKQRLQQLSVAIGPCHLLSINSNAGGAGPGTTAKLWQGLVRGVVPGGGAGEPADRPALLSGGLGGGLSQADVAGLASFVQELAVRGVVPHIEARIRALDQAATAARRGLRNQLKSLLFRKVSNPAQAEGPQRSSPGAAVGPDSAAAGSGASVLMSYPHNSIEAQLRQLSDLCIMVGDFDTALSTLRLLAVDFKGDKAYKHYAAVQEAMAAVTVLSGGSHGDTVVYFQEAYHRYRNLQQYSATDTSGSRYATRTAMLMAAYFGASGHHADASLIAMKAHFQEANAPRCGLLIESAGHALLRLRPPQLRKFAFSLVLAALRYTQGGQHALSQRAYSQALSVYAGRGWEMIEEHVREALGKGYMEAKQADRAVRQFAATLLSPQVPVGMQRLHVEQFMNALQCATEALGYAPLVDLPLPVVDCHRVGLSVAGQASYAGIEARQVPHREWLRLEAALQPATDTGPTWLDAGSRTGLAAHPGHHTCCAGEDVGLDVDLANPLHIELPVTRLRLVCEFERAPAANAAAAQPAAIGEDSAGADPHPPPFQVREERITLHGGERAVVQLRVRPLRPGTLTISGVAWVFNGIAHGQRGFELSRPRPLKPNSSTILLDAERPAPGGLVLRVLPPMPRLEMEVHGLPATVLEGQVVQATLQLRNTGSMPMHSMCMAAGTGELFLGPGNAFGCKGGAVASTHAHLDTTDPVPSTIDADAKQNSMEHVPTPAITVVERQGVPVFCMAPGTKLGVHEQLSMPIWFRPARPGPARFSCVWYYEPMVKLDALRFRTLRASFTSSALPSLQLTAAVAPAAASHGLHLLQLRAVNLQGLETFHLTALCVPGGTWSVRHLEQGQSAAVLGQDPGLGQVALDLELGPEAAAGLHFHLTPQCYAPEFSTQGCLSNIEAYLCGMSSPDAAIPASFMLLEPSPPPAKTLDRQLSTPPGVASHPVDVVVKWRAASSTGDHSVTGLHVVQRVRFQAGPPVHVQLIGPDIAAHDFGQSPLCTLDVVLRLHNAMPVPAAIQVEVGCNSTDGEGAAAPRGLTPLGIPPPHGDLSESSTDTGGRSSAPISGSLPTPTAAAGPPARGVSPAPRHIWCGLKRVTLLALQGQELVELPLRVAVSGPGWLALNDYAVSWRYEGALLLSGGSRGAACFVSVVDVATSAAEAEAR